MLDRSVSMGGPRIQIAIQACILFMQSLPTLSRFNIVSFGTRHTFMFPQSVEYSD